MSDQENEYERKLKRFSVKQIEEAIAKAVSEMAGSKYSVEINNIEFNPKNASFFDDINEVKLIIQKCREKDDGLPF